MKPHEVAALERVPARKREELRAAYEELDRIRTEHPGVDDVRQLPEDARQRATRALLTVRRLTAGGGMGVVHAASLVMVALAAGALWLKPTTAYRCQARSEGRVECQVSERLLGLLTLRSRTLDGIAGASYGAHTERSQSPDDKGRMRETSSRVEELLLKDAEGGTLWRTSESLLVGASLEEVAGAVDALASGERREPFVGWHAPWPLLLIASLFLLLGLSHLLASFGQWLRLQGFIPEALYQVVFYWGTSLAVLVLLACAWGVAWLGGRPPAWLVARLLP